MKASNKMKVLQQQQQQQRDYCVCTEHDSSSVGLKNTCNIDDACACKKEGVAFSRGGKKEWQIENSLNANQSNQDPNTTTIRPSTFLTHWRWHPDRSELLYVKFINMHEGFDKQALSEWEGAEEADAEPVRTECGKKRKIFIIVNPHEVALTWDAHLILPRCGKCGSRTEGRCGGGGENEEEEAPALMSTSTKKKLLLSPT